METTKSAVKAIPLHIDRDAPVVVRRDRVIAAPIETLWRMHTDIARWPVWQKDIVSASLHGEFAAESCFTWTTAGLATPVVSTIYHVDPLRAVLWGGPSSGIVGIHHWMFESVAAGTRITTEESWSGPAVDEKPSDATAMLATSLERWLGFFAAEAF